MHTFYHIILPLSILLIALCSNHPVTLRENILNGKVHRYGQVHIGSHHLATAIKRLGVGERKSFTVCPCEDIPRDLLSDYWRGLFDGDGFIAEPKRRVGWAIEWSLGVVGNQAIVSGFEAFIRQRTGYVAQVGPQSRIFIVRYQSIASLQAILDILYRDATLFLERKHHRMMRIIEALAS